MCEYTCEWSLACSWAHTAPFVSSLEAILHSGMQKGKHEGGSIFTNHLKNGWMKIPTKTGHLGDVHHICFQANCEAFLVVWITTYSSWTTDTSQTSAG